MARRPIRIAVLYFVHETVTFLRNDTTLDDFVYEGSPAKGEALLAHEPKSYMGGFVKVAREFDGVELVGIESPLFPKTGTGSGWITREAYETFVGRMIEEIAATGPYDGVDLSLHGAMGVRGVPRPEADLARRVRAVVGSKAFIVGTFDPHSNEDEEFLRQADMAFTVKYFPHYDSHLQGERAARMLVRAIRGDYKPATVTQRVPIISPTVLQWTGASPWMDLVQRALTWEAREPDAHVNFFFGFPFADVPDVGMTFQVMTNGNPAWRGASPTTWRQPRGATRGADRLDQGPHDPRRRHAREGGDGAGATPVVLADHSDRSGSATWILKEVVEQDLSDVLIATIADAKAIDALRPEPSRPGDPFDMAVGGRVDKSPAHRCASRARC